MIVNVTRVDVTPYLNQPHPPSCMLQREGVFWVPQHPLLGQPIEWSFTERGDAVRVPVFAYRLTRRDLTNLFGLGVEIGMRAVMSKPDLARMNVQICHLLLGACIDLPAEDTVRAFLGVAFQVSPVS